MSVINKSILYSSSDIIPVINVNEECGDHNNNYVITPLPREILSSAKSNAKAKAEEAVYPLDSRFVNFYNNETKKYSLPFLNDISEYQRLYAYFLRNASLVKLTLGDSIDVWEIDNSIDASKLFIQIVD